MLQRMFFTRNLNYKQFEDEFKLLNRGEAFTVFTTEDALEQVYSYLNHTDVPLSLDIETTSTDPFCGNIVLTTFQLINYIITFDNITIPAREMFSKLTNLPKKEIIAHNAMFEVSWLMAKGCDVRNIYCTMLAEQKLYQGADDIKFNIIDTLIRRGLAIPEDMNKDVRKDFNSSYTQHELVHVLYNQSDTIQLKALKAKQLDLLDQLNLNFYVKQIHFPLIRVLAKAQLEGIKLNEPKFLALAEQAEITMKSLETNMNSWLSIKYPALDLTLVNKPLKKLKDSVVNKMLKTQLRIQKLTVLLEGYKLNNKTHLKAYSTSENSLRKAYLDLELDKVRLAEVNSTTGINWSSSDQVVNLLQALGCKPVPVAKDLKLRKFKPSLSKAARERWILKNRDHEFYELISSLDHYMQHTKHVSSFGKSFIEKYKHPVTNKYHTSYKQGTVATGRLASGDSKANPPKFNSQQIIADKELRECFITDPGYLIGTVDLSGAELVTMCSLANDLNLLKLSEGDMHSHFANKGWKAIYASRRQLWTEADVISKTQNKEKRTEYKPMLFGTVYGLKAPKAGETLNISEAEGQIAINTIIEEIPDTIKMVTEAVKFALRHGYVIHNDRTKSRRWFSPVLNADRDQRDLTFPERKDVEGGARNCRIQGTQADMLCESMVMLQRFIDFHKLDAVILLQVHDELVVKFHESYKDWFPQRIADVMTRTANKYLRPEIKMHADVQCGLSWTK